MWNISAIMGFFRYEIPIMIIMDGDGATADRSLCSERSASLDFRQTSIVIAFTGKWHLYWALSSTGAGLRSKDGRWVTRSRRISVNSDRRLSLRSVLRDVLMLNWEEGYIQLGESLLLLLQVLTFLRRIRILQSGGYSQSHFWMLQTITSIWTLIFRVPKMCYPRILVTMCSSRPVITVYDGLSWTLKIIYDTIEHLAKRRHILFVRASVLWLI